MSVMIDVRLRPVKENILRPVALILAPRISAATLTTVSLSAAVASAGLAWAGWWLPALAAWLVSRFLDGLDGTVARVQGSADDRGGYFDMLGDTVGYAFIPVGVALGVDERFVWITLGFLLASFYLNTVSWAYLAAILEKRGAGANQQGELTTITMPPAIIEGAETVLLFSVFLAFPAIAGWVFAVMAGFVAMNVIQRALWVGREL